MSNLSFESKPKLSEKQRDAFKNSNARINIFEGSVSGGKSYIAMYRFLDEVRAFADKDYDFMISGKSVGSIMRNVINPMNRELGGIINYNHSRNFFRLWGNTIYVIGASNARAEGKIRGWSLSASLIDEATMCTESFIRMGMSRLRVPPARCFITTNPDSKYHWLNVDYLEKFKDDPIELKSFKFSLDDNPSLHDWYKEALKKEYSGLYYRRFILGEWVQAEGAIYDFFDEDYHVVRSPPAYAKYYIVGVDYGTANPFSALLIGFNDSHHPAIWVEKEFYWDPKKTGRQKTDAEFGRDLEINFSQYSPRAYYLDPSAKSFELEMKRLQLPVFQADNSVLDGIRSVSTLLSQGDLVVCKDCINLISEIEGYVWDDNSYKSGKEAPIKTRDHAVDALRYAIYTRYGNRRQLKESNPHEEKLKKWDSNPFNSKNIDFRTSFGWTPYN